MVLDTVKFRVIWGVVWSVKVDGVVFWVGGLEVVGYYR